MNSEKTLLVGSSHMVRMKHAFDSGVLPNTEQYVCQGHPGTPLWNVRVFTEAKEAVSRENIEKVVLFVPDLRFGNKIDRNVLNKSDLFSGYAFIKKEHINLKKDLALAEKTIDIVEKYISNLPVKTYVMFYDLFFRQVWDAWCRKQRNPIFNLKSYENYFGSKTYRLNYQRPEEDFACLLSDASLHPSNLGFLSLFHVLHHQESVVKNYDLALEAAEDNLNRRLKARLMKMPKGTLIFGDSICVKDLIGQLGQSVVDGLAKAGIFIMIAPPPPECRCV